MKALEKFHEIYLFRPFTDMRKQISGLAAIVEADMRLSPAHLRLFVFTHRRRRILKLLYWNGSGFALWMTKLEKQCFRWPKEGDDVCHLSIRELELLLDGLDITKAKPHQQLNYSTFS